MKKFLLMLAVPFIGTLAACSKSKDGNTGNSPRTEVPADLRGGWMYGQFSMNEYWSQDPADYLGNAFEVAIASNFNADGTYGQYFTSRTVLGGATIFHRSFSSGTVVVDDANKTFTTYPLRAHYKRTSNGKTQDDRDLGHSELSGPVAYTYLTGVEANGTQSIQLRMDGTSEALLFYKQQ